MNIPSTLVRACRTLLPVLLAPVASRAQSATSSEIGRTITLQSAALAEQRAITVALPRGYETSTERYPVIVVLDGEANHDLAAVLSRHYASTGMMPRAIVVSVRNTSRTRDLTPAPIASWTPPPEAQRAGGAERFLKFLSDELLPQIDRDYRTVPMRTIVGHSLGGLFALHALTTRPDLFTGYVVLEPSIWWNDEHEWRNARDVLRSPHARRARVILVNTPALPIDTTRWGGDAPMVRHADVSGETHTSMAAAGMLVAFRRMFADFRPRDWQPNLPPSAILTHYDSLAARVGYDVPVPAQSFERAIRMSIHARLWGDAEGLLARMAASLGEASTQELREMLAAERTQPAPAGLIPLVIPARRPSPNDAKAFLGKWRKVDAGGRHEIDIRAAGDTIIVFSRVQFPDGSFDEGTRDVIGVTAAGSLEWGMRWFRGIAALLVLKGRIMPDGTMLVEREPRGWVPRGPAGEMRSSERFQRDNRP